MHLRRALAGCEASQGYGVLSYGGPDLRRVLEPSRGLYGACKLVDFVHEQDSQPCQRKPNSFLAA